MAWPSRESVRQSEFVFRATVEKIGASSMPEVPASDRTLVASVTEVYRAPDVLRHLAGRSITVLANDAALQAGQDVLFLARGWLYGHSLAVIEVAREVTSVDFKGLPQQLSAEAQVQRDEALTARLRRASLVVSARVAQTRSLGPVDPVTVSEHTPYWSEAVLDVQSVEKGSLQGASVVVLYPESQDIMWHEAPKLRAGQQGVFVLTSGRVEGVDREALTALDPLDVHPPEALDRVRALIRAGG